MRGSEVREVTVETFGVGLENARYVVLERVDDILLLCLAVIVKVRTTTPPPRLTPSMSLRH